MGEEEQSQYGAETNAYLKIEALAVRLAAVEQEVATLRATATPIVPLTQRAEVVVSLVPPVAYVERQDSPTAATPPPPLSVAMTAAATALPARASLENRLGSQVFSRVGIIALLFGATWFLKLAIDNQWIGPIGRVLAGLIAGAALVVWSERFRLKGFNAFSYSLKAVGSGVLYLSLWAAFQLYHLLPAGAALGAMLLVTAWNAYMAWSQDAQVLAAYAMIGGCATPLLVSNGGNHEVFLFTYILAIDVAMVVLVRLRGWPRLLFGVFPATVAYFVGWYSEYSRSEYLIVTSIFVALFFLVFATVPLRVGIIDAQTGNHLAAGAKEPRQRASVITEILLPLGNAAFAALAFCALMEDAHHHGVLPWLVLIFAALYLGMMKLPQSAAASAIHLSLAIVFLTIAIPLKASGHWITVSWLAEGTILLWVSARLAAAGPVLDDSPAEAYRVLRILAVSALLLGLGGLLARTYWLDYSQPTAFLNHRFATALVGVTAFAAAAWIALHVRSGKQDGPFITLKGRIKLNDSKTWLQIGGGSIIALNVVAVLAFVREIAAFWRYSVGNPEAELKQALATSAFLMAYGGGLLTIGFWKRTAFIRWQALLLIVFTIAKTFLYDMRSLSQGYRVASFMALGALLLAVSYAYQKDWLSLKDDGAKIDQPGATQSAEESL